MHILPLPFRPTVSNAPRNAAELAAILAFRDGVACRGRQPAQGGRCSMCGRRPPSDSLFEIQIDSAQDAGVRIGFDRCRGDHLLPAVLRLLDRERQKRQPDLEVIRRLEVKKAALAV